MVSGEMGLSDQAMLAPPTVYSDAAADNAAIAYSPENYQPGNGGTPMQSFAPGETQTPGFPPPMTIDGNLDAGNPLTDATTFAAGDAPGLGAMPPEVAPPINPETTDQVAAEMQNLSTAVESLGTIITQAPDLHAAVQSPEFNGQLDALVASAEQLGKSAADSGLQQMQPGAAKQHATSPTADPALTPAVVAPPTIPQEGDATTLAAGELPADPYAFTGGETPVQPGSMPESVAQAAPEPMSETAMAPMPETAMQQEAPPMPEAPPVQADPTAESLSTSPDVADALSETSPQPGVENFDAAAPLESAADQPETTTDQLQKKLDQVKADLVKMCEGDVSREELKVKVLEIMRAAMLVGFSEKAAELGQNLSVADIESIFPPAPTAPNALPPTPTGVQDPNALQPDLAL